MAIVDYNIGRKQKIWEGIDGVIHHSEKMTMAYINIKAGTVLPQHSHVNEQWSHILEGTFEFTLNGEAITYNPGQSCLIPSHVPHAGRALTDCKILDTFTPPREDWKDLPYID